MRTINLTILGYNLTNARNEERMSKISKWPSLTPPSIKSDLWQSQVLKEERGLYKESCWRTSPCSPATPSNLDILLFSMCSFHFLHSSSYSPYRTNNLKLNYRTNLVTWPQLQRSYQMFGGASQFPTIAEHAIIKSLSTVQTTKQCPAVVGSWEEPPNICLTAAKNAFVGWALNFRVRTLLKGAVIFGQFVKE